MSEFFKGNMNHDYPYHDILYIDNSQGADPISGSYQVGQNNVDAHGDQKKLFVSKRTLIYSASDDNMIRLNDARNVDINPMVVLVTSSRGTIELWTDISRVYYTVAISEKLAIYFEGVLSEEARDAE